MTTMLLKYCKGGCGTRIPPYTSNWTCTRCVTKDIVKQYLDNKFSNKEQNMTIVNIKYPEPGKLYNHYKGGIYEVLTLAKHSETDETLVIYKSVHFGSVHARPLEQWFEKISNDPLIYRFELKTQ